ncbi:uncharacterized protein LOC132637971 [Lycium barbarum]|uniref:uncharacterized protein LOC132637971 n=1 Tax=Lycium barbarum TaxID=112863 RepID=UPI00293E6E9D|nr:uncharacterized protein LOC132637971 [Lycium barbarum]
MVNKYKVDMVAISEPMVNKNKVEGYKRYLGFNHCITNPNGKIWCFWRDNGIVTTIKNHDQLITMKIQENTSSLDFYVTAVYAKCKAAERLELWSSLEDLNNYITSPWCIGGDFNIILYPEEKLGGRPHRNSKSFAFTECMDSCGMANLGYIGSKYTWCNNRRPCKRIWKRLDRIFINDLWAQKYNCNSADFKTIVAEEWNCFIEGNPMWRLQQKLKNLGRRLSKWSREEIGDVHENTDDWEAKMQFLEEMDLAARSENSREDLNRGHAEYVCWLNKQDNMLKQKSHIRWFEDGDSNTKYFHAAIRERRRKLNIQRIMNKKGNWISGEDRIARNAVNHFEKIFNLKKAIVDPQILNCIPECISDEDNSFLIKCPEEDEIKETVFNMSTDSAAGPDGYTGKFNHCCWDIIKREVVEFFQFFFMKGKMTKFFSHTLLVLIPKVESPSNFTEFRPISLSNFSSKIITKLISRRLNPLLPLMISENQSGFLKGRLITENVQLTQEIVQNIKCKNKGGNVVIKLDMAKAYDGMSWSFIKAVLNNQCLGPSRMLLPI